MEKNTPARIERRSKLCRKFERRARNTGRASTYKSPSSSVSPPISKVAQSAGFIVEQSEFGYIRDGVQDIWLNVSLNKRFLSLANENSLTVMPTRPSFPGDIDQVDYVDEQLEGHITAGCYSWSILGEEFFQLVNILLHFFLLFVFLRTFY